MKLGEKLNIISILISSGIIIMLVVSLVSLASMKEKAEELHDITLSLDFFSTLKVALEQTSDVLDIFMEMPVPKYSKRLIQHSENFDYLLSKTYALELDESGRDTLLFLQTKLPLFSKKLTLIANIKGPIRDDHRVLYSEIDDGFLEQARTEVEKQWNENMKKISRAELQTDRVQVTIITVLALFALLFLSFIIGLRFIFVRKFIHPLEILSQMSCDMADEKLDQRIEVTTGDEIEELADNFNKMAGSLQEKLDSRKRAYEKEQRLVRELSILNELMGQISSEMKFDAIVESFIFRTKDLMKASAAAIFVYEEHKKIPKLFLTTAEWLNESLCLNLVGKDINDYLNNQKIERKNNLNVPVGEKETKIENFIAISLDSSTHHKALLILVNKEGGFSQETEDILLGFTFQAFMSLSLHTEITNLATTDSLTGLNNHRIFQEKLSDELERAKRYNHSLSVLLIDIDHFKSFNDLYGHQTGDDVLRAVGRVIKDSIRNVDFPARYGGEEFVVVLPETPCRETKIVSERIRKNIAEHSFSSDGRQLKITVSIGFSCFPEDAKTKQQLISKADEFLYYSKENGRNMVYNPRMYEQCDMKDHIISGDDLKRDEVSQMIEIARNVDSKSCYTHGHSFEVAAYAVMIGKELGLESGEIENLRVAGLLHDIGNLGIPDRILNKPSPLTEHERKILQGHPKLAEMLLNKYPKTESAISAILYHHERFDGKGYPIGLEGKNIPLLARILAVVEAFQAMTSNRPYREKLSEEDALKELRENAGTQFDPEIVAIFMTLCSARQDPSLLLDTT